MESKGRRLKQLLDAPEITIAPGVYDGYSVRMAAKYGFATAAISGAGLSESHLGWSDRGIMGYEDNLRFCRALVECSGDLLWQIRLGCLMSETSDDCGAARFVPDEVKATVETDATLTF